MVKGKKRVLLMRSDHHGQYRFGQEDDELAQRRGGFGAPFMRLGRQASGTVLCPDSDELASLVSCR